MKNQHNSVNFRLWVKATGSVGMRDYILLVHLIYVIERTSCIMTVSYFLSIELCYPMHIISQKRELSDAGTTKHYI